MVDRGFGRLPNQGGLPKEGSEYILGAEKSDVLYVYLDAIFEGHFDKPLPPKERSGPPATFRRSVFIHLPTRAISFLDSPFWDISKPTPE